jgi:hypothetical protein
MQGKADQECSDKNSDLPQEESRNLERFLPFSEEINLHILRFFGSQDLHQRVALVNPNAYRLANIVQVERYQRILAHSQLWRCLPAIVSDTPGQDEGAFIHYLTQALTAPVVLPVEWAVINSTFSAFINAWMVQFNLPLGQLGMGVSSYTDIQSKARSLMTLLGSEQHQESFLACTELKEVINLANDQVLKIEAWYQYDSLDRIFSSLLLFIALSHSPVEYRLTVMCTPHLSRGLTGTGLMALETRMPGTFPSIVREAIRINALPIKLDEDNARLKTIENILVQLTEDNLLSYLASGAIHERRLIFIEAIRANYGFMMEKLSEAVLLKTERPCDRQRPLNEFFILPCILQSSLLLKQLSKKGLIDLLNRIYYKEIEQTIRQHPALFPLLTFEVLKDWVNSDELKTRLVKSILTQKELLKKLNHDQIVILAKDLIHSDSDIVLESPIFQEILSMDTPQNNLLMKLAAASRENYLGCSIAKNHFTASLLNKSQIKRFISDFDGSCDEFAKHDSIMAQFSTNEIFMMMESNPFAFYYPAYNRLKEFTHDQFVSFSTECLEPRWLSNYPEEFISLLLTSLPLELDRRAVSDNRMSESQWFNMACSHPDIGLFIAQKYLHKIFFHLSPLRDFYREKEVPEIVSLAQTKIDEMSQMLKRPERLRESAYSYYVRVAKEQRLRAAKTENDLRGVKMVATLFVILLVLLGVALLCTGVGSYLGFAVATNINNLLFSSLTVSTSLVSVLAGVATLIVCFGAWIATIPEDDVEPQTVSDENGTAKSEHFSYVPPDLDKVVSDDNRAKTSYLSNTTSDRQIAHSATASSTVIIDAIDESTSYTF